jgi:NADPH-dependent glutamate synthase beta subunit-like oxidoreductase
MKSFKHYNARSLKEAATLLAKYNGKARINAGGTDLLGAMRNGTEPDYPEALINIKNIKNLDYIKAGARGLRIGALTRLADVVKSPAIKQDYPMLAEAAHSVATPNLRNMATVGGNLAQDVRCWYYRYPQQIGGPIVCLRKGGKICNALVGDNRYHSIFGAAPAAERRCAGNCPAKINIPGYMRQVREGNFTEAARILMNRNPMPAITGRVCPIFCEPHCNRNEYDEAVAIHFVERGLGDFILDHTADYFAPPEIETDKTVAVVGAGPAGLSAAYYLRRLGYRVSVYDKMPEPGGMLLYSIPPYRLPKKIVRKLVQALELMGVGFKANVEIENRQTIASIRSNSDAVLLAGGTWKSLKLGVPGEEGRGVHYALDYLCKINSGEKLRLGKRVIVIGGGSVAIDAARTARRLGSDEVHLVCLETRDLSSKDRMPALDNEILQAEEEGIIIHPSLGIRGIMFENSKVCVIETKKCTSVREPDGCFNPQYDEADAVMSLSGESVIIAIGQAYDESLSIPGSGADGIFVAGDMKSGPSTVIQAIASAQKTVQEIEKYLGGKNPEEEATCSQLEYSESFFESIPRAEINVVPVTERIQSIDMEDAPGISPGGVETEARRCVSCGCLAIGASDLAIVLAALDASIVTTRRKLAAQDFFAASATSSTVLEQDELIKEIQIPKPPRNSSQRYLKFTLRKPVDFALVSVASVFTFNKGVCSDARIVLGAVAPSPLRAKAAEAAIEGKPIDEKGAEEAARLALAEATPLSMNSYKIAIARTLVKRSILANREDAKNAKESRVV